MSTAMDRRRTAAQYAQQVDADMATVVTISRIAVVLRVVSRQPGSGVEFRKDRMAIIRPRRAESEDGQHQP